MVVELEEHRQDLAGVAITVDPLRYYPGSDLAGHLLGYIHSINEEELAAAGSNYSINSLIGKSGVEKTVRKCAGAAPTGHAAWRSKPRGGPSGNWLPGATARQQHLT
jgi:hypothetical protein